MPGSLGSVVGLLDDQTWQGAFAWTVVLTVLAVVGSQMPPGAVAHGRDRRREAAIVMGLLGLWRYVGHYVRLRVEGGMENG